MNVDTYTVSSSATGYESTSLSGVTIQGDQIVNIGNEQLQKTVSTIGRTVGRSPSSVFQPQQTTDAYTISGERLLQTTGKAAATDEKELALSVPGVSITSLGNITIRGGLRTEVGYQMDGVPFTEPFFSENGSANQFNGVGSLNVVEGAGDATQANVGAGVFNLIPKRGTNPGFGYVDAEVGTPGFFNQAAFEWGTATADGRISNYIAYTGQWQNVFQGYNGANAAAYGNYFAPWYQSSQQWLDNFIVKFGKDLNQSLQVLYVNDYLAQYGSYGGASSYYTNDPTNPIFGYWNAAPGANYTTQFTPNPDTPANPNAVPPAGRSLLTSWDPTTLLKFEYDNNLDSATFLRLRYYNEWLYQNSSNDNGSTAIAAGGGLGAYPTLNETGGQRVGGTFDLQRQFGNNLTVSLEGTYETSRPIWNGFDPNALGYLLAAGAPLSGGVGPSEADFLPGGYLSTYFPNGIPNVPTSGINYNGALFQQFGGGIRFQYNVAKWKFDIGVRLDQQIQKWGYNPFNPQEPNNPSDVNPNSITPYYLQPHELQPRGAISYQFGNFDSLSAGYGRSAEFLNAQTAGTPAGLYGAEPYLNVPAQTGSMCGSGKNPNGTTPVYFPCQNYAQELYWLYDQNFDAPDYGGALPAVYNNYDLSYQHLFSNGLGLKIVPYYRQGTDLPSFAVVSVLSSGAAVFTVNNEGINKASGVELGVSTKNVTTGFSGFLSGTYQNVISSNPPLVAGEDSLPINFSGSLALGDTYRAAYVSPVAVRIGGDYKFGNGFRTNLTLQLNDGYPYGIGTTTASYSPVNGEFVNLPQVNFGPALSEIGFYQGQSGASVATQYVDPANPGNSFAPNIDATRGTPATSSTGGELWHPNLQANFTLEYKHGHNVLGVQIHNLFGNWYNGVVPTINPYYQPVAGGTSGPLTGVNPYGPQGSSYLGSPAFANLPQDSYAFNNGAYLLIPNSATNGSMPGNVLEFYYQYQF